MKKLILLLIEVEVKVIEPKIIKFILIGVIHLVLFHAIV